MCEISLGDSLAADSAPTNLQANKRRRGRGRSVVGKSRSIHEGLGVGMVGTELGRTDSFLFLGRR